MFREAPAGAQEVVDAVHAYLRSDERIAVRCDAVAPVIEEDDVACLRLDFDLSDPLRTPRPMCGVRVCLDGPFVEFILPPAELRHWWPYASFLPGPPEDFRERLHAYLDWYEATYFPQTS